MNTAREIALKGIYQVNEETGFSNLVVNNLLNQSNLDKRDKSLATQLIYGVLRRQKTLDWIINHFANRQVKKMTPWVRNALRLGVYQIKFLDKIPVRAACYETVEVAKNHCNPGAVKFINGILRNYIRNQDQIQYPKLDKDVVQHIRYKYSYPQWLVQRWVKDFGVDETIQICKNLNQVPSTVIRTNTLKVTREQLLSNLKAEGVVAKKIDQVAEAINLVDYSAIENLETFQAGQFLVQGLSSMLVGHILAPSDETVVDLCSAPGGKTTHLAQLMNNQGLIYAVDVHQHKLELIKDNCQRLGIENVKMVCADGREFSIDEQVDKVLVDAPCSGLGIIGKKPEIKWQKKPQDLEELQKLQLELLSNAAQLVKDGGEIIYSTCTFTSQENIQVIHKFLDKFDNFSLSNITTPVTELGVADYLTDGCLQLLPTSELIEGFFIAKLNKSEL